MTLEHAPTLIGLTGPNGAGKDTAAEMLAGKLTREGRSTVVMAFADALYEEVSAAFGVSIPELKDRNTKEAPADWLRWSKCNNLQFWSFVSHRVPTSVLTSNAHSPRQILQWWGTEYRRAQQPDYWVQRMLAKVQQHREAGVQHIIVTDVRFADEADCIRALGGQIWRIHRPTLQHQGTGHVSEVTGEEFAPEVTIRNEGSMELLRIYLLQALHRADSKHKEAQWQSSKH